MQGARVPRGDWLGIYATSGCIVVLRRVGGGGAVLERSTRGAARYPSLCGALKMPGCTFVLSF